MVKVEADLLTSLRGTVARYGMFMSGQTVVVGVSGGPDSTALLYALTLLREELGLFLVACHVNHGIRGADSDADADYVRELCVHLKVECRVKQADVPAIQKRRHVSTQQAARDIRHALLRYVANETGAERIALAHTRNDRTETILLNILRGGGLEGLSGFAPVALPLVRPLYDVTRAQVERFCAEHGLQPRQDSSNTKTTYRRNRIRLELLPQLRAYYNPHADESLLRLADLARDDNALLEQMASQVLADLRVSATNYQNNQDRRNNKNTLPLSDVNALPIALRRRVLRQAIAQVRGHLQDITFEMLETFLMACEQQTAYSVELPSTHAVTIRLHCDGQRLLIAPAQPPVSRVAWQMPVAVPGRTFVPQAGVTISVKMCSPGDSEALIRSLPVIKVAGDSTIQGGLDVVPAERGGFFLWERKDITLPLVVRSWLPGDRIRPRGLNGTKKLQDIFTEVGLSASERGRVPVLVDDAGQGRILVVGDQRVEASVLFAARLTGADFALRQWLFNEESNGKRNQELFAIALEYE